MTLAAAVSMGRYGGYVWSCYGLSLLALSSLALAARRRRRAELNLARRRARATASARTPEVQRF
jgi:heme exporter protein CcmD